VKNFLRGAQIFLTTVCPIVLNYVQNIFPWGQTIFLRSLFTGMLTWGPTLPQSLHLPRQAKSFQPSQPNVLCTKERDDIRPQTKNVRAPVVFGLYCPSSQNLIKKFCMKSRSIVKVSSILFFVLLFSQ